jgi:hypothetical protein
VLMGARVRLVAVVALVVGVAAMAWIAVQPALGQHEGGEKKTCQVTGEVVGKAERQITVRDDETGEVVVFNPSWVQNDAGQWMPKPDQIEFMRSVEKGDRVKVSGTYEEERWHINDFAKLEGGSEQPAGGDMGEVMHQLAAIREQMSQMQADMAEMKALLKQLAEK